MAPVTRTLAARAILIGLVIHAVLLPPLFIGLLHIVQQSQEDLFVNDARKYSRFVADVMNVEEPDGDTARIVHLLDSAMLGSNGVYADLIEGDSHIRSSLLPAMSSPVYREDFDFGEHGDDTYFLSIPLDVPGRDIVLRMGFDEQPTMEQVRLARNRLGIVLLLYLILSIIALVLFSTRMTRPLRALRRASRNIAEGQHLDRLQVDSSITEIRELARDLESMRRELMGMNASLLEEIAEKEAAEQRRELLEQKLRQAQKLETIGVLAGGIAHEFNNILVPIFLYTEQAMQDLPPGSPVQENLRRVLKSSKRAKGLVQQILTFSRQTGEVRHERLDMKTILAETRELLRALIPSTVDLRQDLPVGACWFMGDRNQIHQLVMNLCTNAYQALEAGGGSIIVTLDTCDVDPQFPPDRPNVPAGSYIRLSVRDTGHGISRGDLERIFEPFYTTRAIGKGTGLGLSVVHGITVAHHGDITVESEPGIGTVFRIYLPQLQRPVDLPREETNGAGQG